MRRNAVDPCKICRIHRKKCVRDSNEAVCSRCNRLEIECITGSDDSDDTLDDYSTKALDGDCKVQDWQADLVRINSEMQGLIAVKTQLEQALVSAQQNRPMEWQFSITNGVMQLETPIQTMEELLMFTQASIRYLSPFTGIFKRDPVHFETPTLSFTFGLTQLIQRRELFRPRRKRFATLQYHDNTNEDLTRLSAAEYRAIIDHLIPLYLEHCIILGLLHIPTFFEYYRSVENPMDDAVILSVCVDALASLRTMLTYSPIKKRILAEVFSDRCKELLFELYDDPKRKLEVIVTTSLLQTYLSDVMLNYLEASRLLSVALLACKDLVKDYDGMSPVKRAIFQRHCFYLEMCQREYQMVFDDKIDFRLPDFIDTMDMLDDESEKTKSYIQICNYYIHLVADPYMSTLLEKIHRVFGGRSCDMHLEDILLFEPFIKDWWSSLPKNLRLCDDPFQPDAYKLVKRTVPSTTLLPFAGINFFISAFCSSILRPSVMPTSENTATIQIIQSVRKRLITLALNACKVLIHSLAVNWNPGTSDTPSFSFPVITVAHYCLEKVASCPDIPFPRELLDMLKESTEVKLRSQMPPGHEVPSSSSIIATYRGGLKQSQYDVYEQYPFPGDALMSDVIRSAVIQLDEQIALLQQ
ncbi:hypothetical protein BJV82DRAFT_671403 [Fennellomyces sp. T-0311]|nr:hypothetical protein BJV82DRAFT_671403 [Fennellomyces sp. T-0311]